MDTEILRKIGLTEGESKVYLALLGLGQSSTGPIIKKAGVTTSKSYKILDRLEEKGLASHVFKKKVKHFKAADPKQVLALVKEKEAEIKEQREEVEKLIPQLVAYQQQIEEEHEAEVYHGIEGLRTLFDEQVRELEAGEPHYVIGIAEQAAYPKDVDTYFTRLQTRRDNKRIQSNFLLGENARGKIQYLENSPSSNVRYIPYASLVAINMYKDVTIIGVFIGSPILFKIKSQQVTENFIKYFELLWGQAKE